MSSAPAGKVPDRDEDSLRLTFVEMLFALAVAQVAIGAADLVEFGNLDGSAPAAISHLTLTLILIAMSWVGWRRSPSPGMADMVKRVASVTFIGLLLDVLLVVAYFVISRNSEVTNLNGIPGLAVASVRPEAFWVCVVFGMYLLWDLVADVLSENCIPVQGFAERLRLVPRLLFACTLCSLVCLLLSFGVYYFPRDSISTWQVVSLDVALIFVVFAFRLLKAPVENFLRSALDLKHCKAFSKEREQTRAEVAWLFLVTIGYIGCIFVGTQNLK